MNLELIGGLITTAFGVFSLYGFMNGAASDWENTKSDRKLFVLWSLVMVAGTVTVTTGFLVAWNA